MHISTPRALQVSSSFEELVLDELQQYKKSSSASNNPVIQ